jgi:hypothetical protein
MPILAQHGFGDGCKMSSGLTNGFVAGAIMSPRDLTYNSLKTKIEELRKISDKSILLFDPQYYATLVAKEPGARMGNLLSDYSGYFSDKQLKELRREKPISEVINKVYQFQKATTGLSGIILPNILIQDGLRSESANIAKLFLEISDEIAAENNGSESAWLTLALGNSCFRSNKDLENLANEITGMGFKSKGIYLLCETTPGNGVNPWHEPHLLSGMMYLNYILSASGYEVINGYSFDNAPFLAAAGGSHFASGWYNTSRYFSLDRYRVSAGMAKRPNRKYLSRALWTRLDFATIRPFLESFPWLFNSNTTDELFQVDSLSEDDECQQHWEALDNFTSEVSFIDDVKERVDYLKQELIKSQQYRSKVITLSMPGFEDRIKDLSIALSRFEELAEL